VLRPVYSDITQLNSTRRGVELRRGSVYSDATQLNSTSGCRQVHSVNNCHRSVLNVVTQLRASIATQLNSTRHRVELSCIAMNIDTLWRIEPAFCCLFGRCLSLLEPTTLPHTVVDCRDWIGRLKLAAILTTSQAIGWFILCRSPAPHCLYIVSLSRTTTLQQ